MSATLRDSYVNAGRSAAELSTQATMRAWGIEGDQAGHAIGHRFMLDQGPRNLFPQDANLNTGAYKTLENEIAGWIDAGAEVRIDIRLGAFEGDRPGVIAVEYTVVDPESGRTVYFRDPEFANAPGQTFDRQSRDRIWEIMEANR